MTTLQQIYEAGPAAERGIIYFIQANDTVKVGYTTHLYKRLADLNTSSPVKLTLMDYVRGAKNVEAALHRELASERLSGEWFKATDKTMDLLDLISDFVETFDDNDDDTDGRDLHVLTVEELRAVIARPYYWAKDS